MTRDHDQAHRDLLQEAELFRFIVESATEYAIFATDREGRIVAWNSGAERVLGYSEAEALGQNACIIFTPEDNEQGTPAKEMREALRAGRAQDQRWHVRKGGDRFWADGLIMPLRDEAGGLRGFVKILRDRTAEKQTDDALRESQGVYRAIATNLPQGAVFLVDRELRYRLADGQALRDAGLSPADLEGKTVREALPAELAGRFEADFRAILAGETIEAVHEDHGRTYSSHGVPLRDASGEVYAALVVSYDITERERLAKAARAEREQLYTAFRLAPSILAVVRGPDHVYALANEGYYRLIGHREVLGRPAREVVPELEAQGHFELLDRVYRTGEPFVGTDVRVMFRRVPDQPLEERFMDFVYQPIREPDGTVSGILAHGIDQTERKRAEERLRRALNVPTVGVLFFRLDGRLTDANAAFERMSGYTAEELRDLTDWMALTAPEHRGTTARVAAELAERGETAPYEKEMLRPDGSRWWGLFAPTRLSGSGRDAECVEFITDVTDRKELERSLRHRVQDLAEADRRKDEFLAMLAHELRNPLSAIHSAVRVAQSPKLAEHLPHTLEIIERQAKNLARLIDDLLDVSRIAQGKVDLRREPIDVIGVINRAAQAVKPLIEQKNHDLKFQHDIGPVQVDADPTRLEQIVGNLLTNAAKYTEPSGHIRVSASREGGEAIIKVKDDGVGISPDMLPKVFDLFTQVDRSLALSEGGLGIGLSLVRRLVELHGGTITATSELGHGSEFTVRLPLVEVKATEAEPPQAAEVSGAGRRVLIVDDNVDTARLTGRLLKSLGFEFRLCHDGLAAIEVAREFRPEVVLLDIGLPGLNGFEVARQLREEACCGDSLIIGVSGYGDARSREQAREAGFDHHLVKPVDIEAVTELVSRPRRPPESSPFGV